jgi:adenosine kinase
VSTDRENNQIASFYVGAMGRADQLSFSDLDYDAIQVAIIAPNAPTAMVKYASECQKLGIPYIYDPSQQIVRLSGADLLAGIRGASVLIGNEYEFGLIRSKTGLSDGALRALPGVTIMTRGGAGSIIHVDETSIEVPGVPPEPLAEPTGVGDAYRAGVIKGLIHHLPWELVGRIGSLAATYVLERHGTQAHTYTREEFVARYRRVFGPDARLDAVLLGPGA